MNKSILVSAYGCEPLKGSEPGVGWNWVLQLAQQNKLYVITRANNKAAIEEYLPTSIRHNITFYYYDTPLFLRQFKNKAKGLYFYYFFWQIGIVSIAKKIIRNNHVDYTMHLTLEVCGCPHSCRFCRLLLFGGPLVVEMENLVHF